MKIFQFIRIFLSEYHGWRYQLEFVALPEIGSGSKSRPTSRSIHVGLEFRNSGCVRVGRPPQISAGFRRNVFGGKRKLIEEGPATSRPTNGRLGRWNGQSKNWEKHQIWRVRTLNSQIIFRVELAKTGKSIKFGGSELLTVKSFFESNWLKLGRAANVEVILNDF
jgi:hypothetical protein